MKILFVHHGGIAGGAPISLLTLLKSLEKKFIPILCNSTGNPQVNAFFEAQGFSVFDCAIPRFPHTSLGSFNILEHAGRRGLRHWFQIYPGAKSNFQKLLREIQPDLVHFNSLTLAPYAEVPHSAGIPTVVHVREPVLKGLFGLRKRWLRSCLLQNADKVLAICKDNLERLRLPEAKGKVLYNPVDFNKFDFTISKEKARLALGISRKAKVVLFAGGTNTSFPVKGLHHFLAAMGKLKPAVTDLVCLMPSFDFPPSPAERPQTLRKIAARALGVYRQPDRLYALTREKDLYENILAAPFTYDIQNWMAACDVVCVLHIRPHFSRTVMEAGAMKKPVVAFRVGGVEEVVQHGRTGLLLSSMDITGVTKSVKRLLEDPEYARQLGEGGYLQARNLSDSRQSASAVMDIYEELLNQKRSFF